MIAIRVRSARNSLHIIRHCPFKSDHRWGHHWADMGLGLGHGGILVLFHLNQLRGVYLNARRTQQHCTFPGKVSGTIF